MSPDPGPSTEIRLDTRARRPPPTDQPAHGDAYGMTQATAASLTILRHPLPAARSFVLALLRALHLAPRLRSAEPSQQRRAADRPNFPLTRGPLTDKDHHELPAVLSRDQYLAKWCSSVRKLATISSDRVGFVCSMAARNSAVVAR